MICVLAFSIRLFAIVKYESIIHEFDPYFNFRTTKYLAAEGLSDFIDWFDDRGWYPLGRTIGGTIYPGIMITAALYYWALHAIHITINIRNVCVFMGPLFAAKSSLAAYLLAEEATSSSGSGLIAAVFLATVPSYISRSAGGSYDYESIAIFIMTFTFYLWIKSVHTGSMMWSLAASLSYLYMVASWGGYVYVINLIAIYTLAMLVAGRFSYRLYVAYTTFYVLGTLFAMQVPFVGMNTIIQAECASSHGVFIALQAYAIVNKFYDILGSRALKRLLIFGAFGVVGTLAFVIVSLQLSGKITWQGRSLTLLDPTYASKFMPIVASISEHQPTPFSSFFHDLHVLVPLSILGLFFLFQNLTDGAILLIIFGTLSWYFASVMVRLMLTLAPIVAVLGGIGLSAILQKCSASLMYGGGQFSRIVSICVMACFTVLGVHFLYHSIHSARWSYSSPSIVIPGNSGRGGRVMFDDYREAYYWLRYNTDPDAKIGSWWDYGYQMSAMSNRTVLVDNNTWNNTHIGTIGRIFSSREERAYPILESLDIDYFLVVFGGALGYSSDDVNKFLWPVRISHGVFGKHAMSERDMMSRYGLDVGLNGNPNFLNSVGYKLCYKDYAEYTEVTGHARPGQDGHCNVRGKVIGNKYYDLTHFEEAFTSENMLIRIYRVLPRPNLEPTKNYLPTKNSGGAKRTKRSATYVGCFNRENFFEGEGSKYIGGQSGSSYHGMIQEAVKHKMAYFAVASTGDYGHSFVFRKMVDGSPKAGNVPNNDCRKPCADDEARPCGCADDYCDTPIPEGEENNRRWAVYKIDDEE